MPQQLHERNVAFDQSTPLKEPLSGSVGRGHAAFQRMLPVSSPIPPCYDCRRSLLSERCIRSRAIAIQRLFAQRWRLNWRFFDVSPCLSPIPGERPYHLKRPPSNEVNISPQAAVRPPGRERAGSATRANPAAPHRLYRTVAPSVMDRVETIRSSRPAHFTPKGDRHARL